MRIGIDARSVCMLQRGMPVYAWNILIHLPKQLPECSFYYFINTAFEHNLPKSEYEQRLSTLSEFANVSIIDIQDDACMYWEQWLLYKACKKHQIDLLHMPANRVCLLYAKKQIVTLHDAIEWDELKIRDVFSLQIGIKGFIYALRKYWYTFIQYQVGLRAVKKIVTISRYAKEEIRHRFSYIDSSLDYIYHGIPQAFCEASFVPIEGRYGVLMLGGESPHKNPFNMLQAYARLSTATKLANPLTVIGIAPHALAQFQKWIEDLQLSEFATLRTWVDEPQLVHQFQNSKLFLFASKEEGFGFPLIQAMRTGTPVIISTCPVLMELSEQQMPSSNWDDVEGMYEHINFLLNHQNKLEVLSCTAVEMAKKFSWEHSVSRISNVYQEVMAENVVS